VLVPSAAAWALPWLPAALLMVATVVFDDDQVAAVVTFCVVPSENVAVAVNCRSVPLASDGAAGVSAIEVSVAGVTVSVVLPEWP